MCRVLLQWRSLRIYSYPAMLYLGMVAGILAQQYAATLTHLDAGRTVAATLILLVPALIGARLLFVLAHWRLYRREPTRLWRRSEGGAAMYGGLLLAMPLSVPVLTMHELPFGAFWDVASFTMLIGMIFARAGCFLNGCCCGRPTSSWLGLELPDHRGVWRRRFPTQILEGVWGLAVLAGAIAIWASLPFPGALFLYTLGAYGAGRIVLESTRQEQDQISGFSVNRTLSTAFVAISLAAFATTWVR